MYDDGTCHFDRPRQWWRLEDSHIGPFCQGAVWRVRAKEGRRLTLIKGAANHNGSPEEIGPPVVGTGCSDRSHRSVAVPCSLYLRRELPFVCK